ncbi:unnamed protein product [Schistocephalus solidus]|uniref:TraG-D_C domain-containing protein n=1 Tax=Schistocephalus solidus TaxID=70667 RepID=A0A183T7S0_SCHSO|nr:unnamed protein product [Schistocephalus solidus]
MPRVLPGKRELDDAKASLFIPTRALVNKPELVIPFSLVFGGDAILPMILAAVKLLAVLQRDPQGITDRADHIARSVWGPLTIVNTLTATDGPTNPWRNGERDRRPTKSRWCEPGDYQTRHGVWVAVDGY